MTRRKSSRERGENCKLNSLLEPLERRARDAAGRIARGTDAPLRPHLFCRFHARMPVPSGTWLLQQSRIATIRGLLHQRGRASDFWAAFGAEVCGDVEAAETPKEVYAGGSWCGRGSAGAAHSGFL